MIRALIIALITASAAVFANPADNDLDWMLGCWASTKAGSDAIEAWHKTGNGLEGINTVTRNGERIVVETLVIRNDEEGRLVLIASPIGQAAAKFKLKETTHEHVVFENPQHDFPQRVIYRTAPPDQLLGRIEGEIDGVSRSVDFPMRRVDCETRN